MDIPISLRPVQQSELPELTRIYSDPAWPGEYQWFGFRIAKARELERRWSEDGLIGGPGSTLTVALEDGTCVGVVSWRPVGETGNFEIGICIRSIEDVGSGPRHNDSSSTTCSRPRRSTASRPQPKSTTSPSSEHCNVSASSARGSYGATAFGTDAGATASGTGCCVMTRGLHRIPRAPRPAFDLTAEEWTALGDVLRRAKRE
jgi:hypothetical protein